MMGRVRFVPMKHFHVKQVLAAPHHAIKADLGDAFIRRMLLDQSKAVVLGQDPDERAVACAGLLDEKEGRARAWALIGGAMPFTAWPALIGEMRAGIEAALHVETGWARRVWAETLYDWPEGHRLLLHLGMSFEGMNRGAFPDGRHGVTYARVRGDVPALPVRCRALMGTVERCLWEDTMSGAVPWAVEEARRSARRAA